MLKNNKKINKLKYLDLLPFGVCVVKNDFEVVSWNKVLENWSGVSKEDILNKNLVEKYPQLNNKRYQKRLEFLLNGGPPVIFSPQLHPHFFPFPLNDGSLRTLQTTVSMIPGENGGKPLLFITVNDMTNYVQQLKQISKLREKALIDLEERKKAAVILEESEEQYRRLVELFPSAVFIQESDEIFFSNEAGVKLAEAEKAADLVGKSILDFIPSEYKENLAASLRKIVSGRQEIYFTDVKFVGLNGENLDVDIVLIPFKYKNKSAVQIILQDITKRKNIESERLHKEKLQGVLEIAGAVCHELNQPMQIALGYSEILLDFKKHLDSRVCKDVVSIKEQIERMSKIVYKLQNITQYKTKDYLKSKIIDIDGASKEE